MENCISGVSDRPKKFGVALAFLGEQDARVVSVVNKAQVYGGRDGVDLSRLNDAERTVLQLLAEGHTAKSIANALGITAAAVNERLREARRKTGIGSSRELARLLDPQKIRHEQIGVSPDSRHEASLFQRDAETRRSKTGVFAMTVLLALTAASAAAFFLNVQTNDEPTSSAGMITDPDLGTFAKEGPAWLYPFVRKEPRDTKWAPAAERALQDRYATIRFFDTKPRVLRVICGTRTCEVAASISPVETNTTYGKAEASIVQDMRKSGLVQTGAMVLRDSKSSRSLYLACYLRTKNS